MLGKTKIANFKSQTSGTARERHAKAKSLKAAGLASALGGA
mgnify:CR=1 FL=1